MLKSIHIKDSATFPKEEQSLENLSEFNFLFGSNGSGKTTISRIIANIDNYPDCNLNWLNDNKLPTMVYNRDFIEKNFNQEASIKGVFTLGEGVKIKQQIDLTKSKLDFETQKISHLNAQLKNEEVDNDKKGKETLKEELEEKLKNECWKFKKKYDEQFKDALAGFMGDSKKFKNKILIESSSNSADLRTYEELEKSALSIFGAAPEPANPVPAVNIDELQAHESNSILKKRVIGKEDVNIAAMIKKLGNSDWVRDGQAYYQINNNNCPFCQQETEKTFTQSLNDYFDEEFKINSNAVNDLLENYKTNSDRLKQQVSNLILNPSRFLDIEKLKNEQLLLNAKIKINIKKLEDKKREPSQIFTLDAIDNIGKSIKVLIDFANKEVTKHNLLVKDLKHEKSKLTSQVWRYILKEMEDDLKEYQANITALEKAIALIKLDIENAQKELKEIEKELQTLEKKETSIQPTLDEINTLLLSYGFNDFSLALSDDNISYKLIRSDGSEAKETLSDGERSFITFLYFYYLLKGSNTTQNITNDRIAVFDDPVSSLDSDVLFIVGSLIKNIFNDIRKKQGHIKQVFILTHNIYFHKEVSYNITNLAKKYRFWTVRKSTGKSLLESHKTNPVKTSYALLWAEVKKGDSKNLTLANTLRRILEHYFKILGDINLNRIKSKFTGNDKIICNSLLSWIHAGSHGILDDVYYSDVDTTIETNLSVFKDIFKQSGHITHYNMMMGINEENDSNVL